MTDRPDAALHVLQHSLGLDEYGEGTAYRNHYVAGPGHHSFDLCRSLVEAGLMHDHGPRGEMTDGANLFTVTDAGREYVRAHSPKLSAGKRRYREWLRVSDLNDMTFGDWLKARAS